MSDHPYAYGGHRRVSRHDGSTEQAWHAYTCWACGKEVGGAVVASPAGSEFGGETIRWLWCPACAEPAVITSAGDVRPGARYGGNLSGLPDDVRATYDEARDCMSVAALLAQNFFAARSSCTLQ